MKQRGIIIAFTLMVLCAASILPRRAVAINEFGIGVNAGLTEDPNNLSGEITRYNRALMAYRSANAGSEIVQLNVPYVAALGVTLRFRIDFFLIRLGCYYSQAFLYPTMGSVKPAAGLRNTVRFETYQVSLPISAGFMLQASRRTIFYFGGGFSTFFVNLEVKQSRPDPAFGLPSERPRDVYDTHVFGYHLFIGTEFRFILKELSISAEWIYQRGVSPEVRSSESSLKRTFDITANYVLFGINYYVTL